MQISCPSCATQFAVPDAALGQKGRTLKCARCGHKWFQQVPAALEPEKRDEPEAVDAMLTGQLLPGFENFAFGGESPALGDSAAETTPAASFAPRSEPMPEALGDSAPRRSVDDSAKRRHGGAWLWTGVVLLALLGGGAYGLFAFQDRVIELWPPAAQYLDALGLRRAVVGAGLTFRNSSSERLIQGDREVLVVRGVIANLTEQTRDVPLMRLALFDNQTLVQDKVVRPPVDGLDGGGTAAFRIVLEQPHPMATRFEVTFTEPAPDAAH